MLAVETTLILLILFGVYFVWIRPWQLRWGATDEEIARWAPGDEIVEKPSFDATRAVTIHTAANFIYPWICQIGMNRAGWYSYDLLDNLGRPSARYLLAEHQETFTDQLIPISPDGKQGLFVKAFQENRWILWWDKIPDTTWFWGIYPIDANQSRLLTRVRIRYHWRSAGALFNLMIEFCDIFMMRKCMLGIRERAENLSNASVKASDAAV